MIQIIENNQLYTMDITFERFKQIYDIHMNDLRRNREYHKRRYISTGKPRGRPKKNSPASSDSDNKN